MDRDAVIHGRRRFAQEDRSERMERMMTDIGCCVQKEDSFAVVDDIDAAAWDRLAEQMREIGKRGHMVIYTLG